MGSDQTTTAIGRLGESIAAAYLELAGFTIQSRNLRRGRHEVDLVVARGDLLCLVEVRLRRRGSMGSAVETVSRVKQQRVAAAAARMAAAHQARACRFDVIAIDWAPDRGLSLVHVVDAFRP
jgi:putative endonuclease